MRKLIGLAVFLLAVGLATAAGASDVAGTPWEVPVGELTDLGLVDGFPDGTFRPDLPVTRAQLAALVIRALGLADTATLFQGDTLFPDVRAVHWASGYINVSSDRGLVIGYPDGTFRPDRTVSGAEAATVLARVLGYGPVLVGPWPATPIGRMTDVGLIDPESFRSDRPITRGDLAVMLHAALRSPVMVVDHAGEMPRPVQLEASFAEYVLGLQPVVGRIVASGDTFSSGMFLGQIRLEHEGILTTWTLAAGRDARELLGREVTGWARDQDLVSLSPFGPEPTSGWISAVVGGGTAVIFEGEALSIRSDCQTYLNRRPAAATTAAGSWAVIVRDRDGSAAFIDAVRPDGAWLVHTASADELSVIDLGDGRATRVRLQGLGRLVVIRDGQPAAAADIRPGEVVWHSSSGDGLLLVASTGSLSGVITSARETDDGITVTIAGQAVKALDLMLSPDGNRSFVPASPALLSRFNGTSAVVRLDPSGRARILTAVLSETPGGWALVTGSGAVQADGSLILPVITEGAEMIASVSQWSGLTGRNEGHGTVEPGSLATGDIVLLSPAEGGRNLATEPVLDRQYIQGWTFDPANMSLSRCGTELKMGLDTAVFDLSRMTQGTVDGFWGLRFARPSPALIQSNERGEVSVVAYWGEDAVAAEVPQSGIVLARALTIDGPVVRLLAGNRRVELAVTDETTISSLDGRNQGAGSVRWTDLSTGDFVRWQASFEGRLQTVTEPAVQVSGLVGDWHPLTGVLWLGEPGIGSEPRLVSVSALVYDVRGACPVPATLSEIEPGQWVEAFTDGGLIAVIRIVH